MTTALLLRGPLRQPIHANRNKEDRAYKCVTLKKRTVDSGEIEFLDFVFVNQCRCNERHRRVIKRAKLGDEAETDQRCERQKMYSCARRRLRVIPSFTTSDRIPSRRSKSKSCVA